MICADIIFIDVRKAFHWIDSTQFIERFFRLGKEQVGMRRFKIKENTKYMKCLKCGNNTEFTAHSSQCAEDQCETWVVCKCGYDPTENKTLYRYKDIWGGICNGNILIALDCWNDAIDNNQSEKTKEIDANH